MQENTGKDPEATFYQAAIIGGGLAGLSLSILLSKSGYSVAVFEKEKYPFHKVCGEYISLESWGFIEALGLKLENFHLPLIKKLCVSSPGGNKLETDLDLGGFGISRYLLDDELSKLAIQCGVKIYEQTKITGLHFGNDQFTVSASGIKIKSAVTIGCFGKRSNLDVKWMRPFVKKKAGKLNNYIGVKYHIRIHSPVDTISLHNFKNGYCGISAIEDGKHCLCYLTTAHNLSSNNNSIPDMEKNVLRKNPFLEKIFSEADFLYKSPETISQISFTKKSQVENHVLMAGDAAGMITPLCGNGMSMGLQAAKIAHGCIDDFLQQKTNRPGMERNYTQSWNRQFKKRLYYGRLIQSFFGKEWITNKFIAGLKYFPGLSAVLIRSTHGKPF
ncbi:MAG: FAD-dependent monooxygenase [Ginsengibacter sp.]